MIELVENCQFMAKDERVGASAALNEVKSVDASFTRRHQHYSEC
jgi:hypothetical protein